MVKKTPKMFFRFNGEDMSLTTIYNKNKKRRGRSRYLLSVQIDVVKDGKIDELVDAFMDAIPTLLKSKLQAA